MDIFVFGIMVMAAVSFIFIDYYRQVPYMGVLGGIILILLGIFLSVDASFTITACGVV